MMHGWLPRKAKAATTRATTSLLLPRMVDELLSRYSPVDTLSTAVAETTNPP